MNPISFPQVSLQEQSQPSKRIKLEGDLIKSERDLLSKIAGLGDLLLSTTNYLTRQEISILFSPLCRLTKAAGEVVKDQFRRDCWTDIDRISSFLLKNGMIQESALNRWKEKISEMDLWKSPSLREDLFRLFHSLEKESFNNLLGKKPPYLSFLKEEWFVALRFQEECRNANVMSDQLQHVQLSGQAFSQIAIALSRDLGLFSSWEIIRQMIYKLSTHQMNAFIEVLRGYATAGRLTPEIIREIVPEIDEVDIIGVRICCLRAEEFFNAIKIYVRTENPDLVVVRQMISEIYDDPIKRAALVELLKGYAATGRLTPEIVREFASEIPEEDEVNLCSRRSNVLSITIKIYISTENFNREYASEIAFEISNEVLREEAFEIIRQADN